MSVFLSNLDDYIAPSQACINPLVATNNNSSAKIAITSDYPQRTVLKYESKPDLIKAKVESNPDSLGNSKKIATVSLNDCLACSGCVTSAETVLIQEQSYDRLLDRLQSGIEKSIIVVAISRNSLCSFADFHRKGITPNELFLKISTILKTMGVTYVIDPTSTADVALVESREEFLRRFILSMKDSK